ncbi:DUF502 domain-containing protein [candidate division KSB1 bacterium]|nr:MAG: DUF502 domain-containing protein [candidate division KSB1 bacterium]
MSTDSPEKTRSFTARFREHFMTGLLVMAPLFLTGYVVVLVVGALGGLLAPYMRLVVVQLLGEGHYPHIITVIADVVGFIITILLVTLVGMMVGAVVGQRAVDLLSSLLGRIPVIRELYTGMRKFGEVLAGDKDHLKRVVAVRFPFERTWRIGFVTNEQDWRFPEQSGPAHVAVFVPGTPNPTSGFLVFYAPEDILPLSLSVDEALKLIVSGGTLTPERFAADVNRTK